jgi:hypothetical protein
MVDCGMGDRFGEVRFAGARWTDEDQVLGSTYLAGTKA